MEPLDFGYNEEMAGFNPLQNRPEDAEMARVKARKELTDLAAVLESRGVKVVLVRDEEGQATPGSVFVADWMTMHEDSRVAAYPLAAANRKRERRGEILNVLSDNGFPIYDIVDVSAAENEGRFLHGAGSLVFDRKQMVAYAALSAVAERGVVEEICGRLGYEPVVFKASVMADEKRAPVHYTNLVLCVADAYAVVCLDAVDDAGERLLLRKSLENGGKTVIEISETQVLDFAACCLPLEDGAGKPFLLLSSGAYGALTEDQRDKLQAFNELVTVDVSTIERVGGSGLRSVVGEIFLPQ